MKYYLKAKEIFFQDGIKKDGYLLIRNGVIMDYVKDNIDKDIEIIDIGDNKLLPGLIDVHIHGANGYDTMDGSYDAINEISKKILEYGVTSFLPTTLTAPWKKIIKAVKNINDAVEKGTEGAEALGAYIEGPYFTEKHKGAHPEEFFRELTISDLDELIEISGNNIKVIALAPEKKGVKEFVQHAVKKGIKITIGHTDASYDQCIEAVNSGASSFVHIYNGMRGLHHREPGVVGAALTSNKTFCEIISDGHHVHPAAIKLLCNCKGLDKVLLITDCMRAGGLKDGQYYLGELKVNVKDGIARTESGSLAGSTLNLIQAVKNIIQYLDVFPLQAVHMASLVPAKFLGMDSEIGSIKIGKRANFVVVDNEFNVKKVFIDGQLKLEN